MAQAKRGVRARTGGLWRRFGVSGRAWVALACAVMVVAAACVAGLRLAQGERFAVERDDAATSVLDKDSVSAAGIEETVVVHVDGAVANPGVYEFAGAGVRVNDAVLAAGGLVEGADTSTINLASPVEDGSKVHVPTANELVSTSAAAADAASGETPASAGAASGGLVNINTASSGQLQSLPGVGEATAAAIIQDRERNGPFSSCEDLMRVSGIGEKKYAKMEALICV